MPARHRDTASEAFPLIPGIRMTADLSGSSLSPAEFVAHVDDTCGRMARDIYHQHGRGIIIVDIVTPDDDEDEDLIRPQWLPLAAIHLAMPSASAGLKRVVETYEPERQAIVCYLKPEGLVVRLVNIEAIN
jgi:hypothetical protein